MDIGGLLVFYKILDCLVLEWVIEMVKKIEVFDGVIIFIFEYDYGVLVVLMNVLEWFFYGVYFFVDKLVMIIGVLYGMFGIFWV